MAAKKRSSKKNPDACPDSPTGEHEADPQSADVRNAPDWAVDYSCVHCGQSGSVAVDPEDIMW